MSRFTSLLAICFYCILILSQLCAAQEFHEHHALSRSPSSGDDSGFYTAVKHITHVSQATRHLATKITEISGAAALQNVRHESHRLGKMHQELGKQCRHCSHVRNSISLVTIYMDLLPIGLATLETKGLLLVAFTAETINNIGSQPATGKNWDNFSKSYLSDMKRLEGEVHTFRDTVESICNVSAGLEAVSYLPLLAVGEATDVLSRFGLPLPFGIPIPTSILSPFFWSWIPGYSYLVDEHQALLASVGHYGYKVVTPLRRRVCSLQEDVNRLEAATKVAIDGRHSPALRSLPDLTKELVLLEDLRPKDPDVFRSWLTWRLLRVVFTCFARCLAGLMWREWRTFAIVGVFFNMGFIIISGLHLVGYTLYKCCRRLLGSMSYA
ncbi:hypothetical protein CPB85DRAFT_1439832 [Mucidula mucida]|nr:hypothetical protein CPB85DRAFT_1439832 [Mucidula mucida]